MTEALATNGDATAPRVQTDRCGCCVVTFPGRCAICVPCDLHAGLCTVTLELRAGRSRITTPHPEPVAEPSGKGAALSGPEERGNRAAMMTAVLRRAGQRSIYGQRRRELWEQVLGKDGTVQDATLDQLIALRDAIEAA